ncbi:MAG: TolC family protein [Chlorobi bacterium]|nr:TolC family protein [Chlorobiota bacterium]
MTKKIIIAVAVFSLAFLTHGVTAQTPVKGEVRERLKVTLQDAVRIGLQNNNELTAARYEVQKAEAKVNEAVGNALPTVNLSGRYSRALKKPVFFLPDFQNPGSGRIVPIEVGSTHSFDFSVSASQILFNSAVFTGIGTAEIYSRAAREVYKAKEIQTIANIRKAFYGVLMAAEVHKMMEENLSNAKENLHNVEVLSKQGLVSDYDEVRASVAVGNLRPLVIQAENNYKSALNGLKIVIGLPVNTDLEIDGNLEFQPVDDELLDRASDLVMETNYNLRALRLQRDVNDELIAIERSDYLPTIAAFGNYQYQAAKNDLNLTSSDFVASSLIGVTLSMNIFKGFQTDARIEEAELELRKTNEVIAGTEKGLKTSAETIVMRIKEARVRIEAQQKTVEQAERGYRIATVRFKSGSGTQLEVNDAQLALTQAKVNRIQAMYDYLVAVAELDEITGRIPDFAREFIE